MLSIMRKDAEAKSEGFHHFIKAWYLEYCELLYSLEYKQE